MDRVLHILSFDVPYPADYGGVIDVFYKLKCLHSVGVKIHLHCFKYGRDKSAILNQYCEKVTYYNRDTSILNFFSRKPYIVKSRTSNELLNNLLKDNNAILYEGVHCTSTLSYISKYNPSRKLFIRAHNIESSYYRELYKLEKVLYKKIFFYLESIKLKLYEKKIYKNRKVFSISESDYNVLKCYTSSVSIISPFHANFDVSSKLGKGDFALFHGNFEVLDNELAALFFIEIFKKVKFPLVVAGRNPSAKLKNSIKDFVNIKLIDYPDDEELFNLIQNAHINLFYSFQSAGVKLKFINALFKGRFCFVNKNYVVNNVFSDLCKVITSKNHWLREIELVFEKSFNQKDLDDRKTFIECFTNDFNLKNLQKEMFKSNYS